MKRRPPAVESRPTLDPVNLCRQTTVPVLYSIASRFAAQFSLQSSECVLLGLEQGFVCSEPNVGCEPGILFFQHFSVLTPEIANEPEATHEPRSSIFFWTTGKVVRRIPISRKRTWSSSVNRWSKASGPASLPSKIRANPDSHAGTRKPTELKKSESYGV